MKRIALFTFLSLISTIGATAQTTNNQNSRDKSDYTWLSGYDTGFGFNKMTFKTSPPSISPTTLCLKLDNAASFMSDSLGNLMFYTNGFFIADSTEHLMQGSDTLSPGLSATETAPSYGELVPQFTLALSYPKHPDQYILIHQRRFPYLYNSPPFVMDTIASYAVDQLNYTVIDMRLNDGKGAVTALNQPLIHGDTLGLGKMTACRHANGVDWWILNTKANSNTMYTILLDSMGCHVNTQVLDSMIYDGVGQACFSPDGTRYAITNGVLFEKPSILQLFDFDRCSGLLSSLKTEFIAPDSSIVSGLSFSPNSRYMYVARGYAVDQYDTEAANFQSAKQEVAYYDGFIDPQFVMGRTYFNTMQLAPDGKIYISTRGGTHYIHRINAPNEAGIACNLIQHELTLPAFYSGTMPNNPNYRLGAIIGPPPCGVLDAVNTLNSALGSLEVYPNPSASNLTIAYTLPEEGNVAVVSALGQVMYERVLAKGDDKLWLNVEDWANGVYFVRLSTPNSGVYSKKVFVLH